jgi:hypothetical protein
MTRGGKGVYRSGIYSQAQESIFLIPLTLTTMCNLAGGQPAQKEQSNERRRPCENKNRYMTNICMGWGLLPYVPEHPM